MANYVDTLLAEGETVQVIARQHWMALIRFALQPIFILIAALVGLAIGQWLQPGEGGIVNWLVGLLDTVVGLVTLGLFILAIVWIPVQAYRWLQRRYVVTTRRVLYAQGAVRRTANDAGLEKITDVAYKQSVLGRKLGYGDLSILTAAGSPLVFDDIIDALDFKKAIMAGQEALVRERAGQILGGAGPAVAAAVATAAAPVAPAVVTAPAPVPLAAPPVDSGAASASAAAPAAAPASPAADLAAPEDVTATLARLSDLRDQGAISEADYEAKKQDLLDRL